MKKSLKKITIASVGVFLIAIIFIFSFQHVSKGMTGTESSNDKVENKTCAYSHTLAEQFAEDEKIISICNQRLAFTETMGEFSVKEHNNMKEALNLSIDGEKVVDMYVDTYTQQQEVSEKIKRTVEECSFNELILKREKVFKIAKEKVSKRIVNGGIIKELFLQNDDVIVQKEEINNDKSEEIQNIDEDNNSNIDEVKIEAEVEVQEKEVIVEPTPKKKEIKKPKETKIEEVVIDEEEELNVEPEIQIQEKEVEVEITIENEPEETHNDNGIPSLDGKLGDIGRLIIPSVNYSVALYDGLKGDSRDAQIIVDAKDSACYVGYKYSTAYIGDHNYQGFSNMKKSVPGVTKAYIYKPNGSISTYLCVKKSNGYNNGEIIDNNGTNIYDSDYDIAMVTCNDSGNRNVAITYWNEV